MGLRSGGKDAVSVMPMHCRRENKLCRESVDYFSMYCSSLLCLCSKILFRCGADALPLLKLVPPTMPEQCGLTFYRWMLKLEVWMATFSRQFQEVLVIFSWTDFFKSRCRVPSEGQGFKVASVCQIVQYLRSVMVKWAIYAQLLRLWKDSTMYLCQQRNKNQTQA